MTLGKSFIDLEENICKAFGNDASQSCELYGDCCDCCANDTISRSELIDTIKSHLNEMTLFDDDYSDGYKMAYKDIILMIENFD